MVRRPWTARIEPTRRTGAVAPSSSTPRGRIARRPAIRFRQRQEALERFVEQRRLLEIEDVAGLRKHRQPGGRNVLFEEQARFDARVILVAHDNKNRRRRRAPLRGVSRYT